MINKGRGLGGVEKEAVVLHLPQPARGGDAPGGSNALNPIHQQTISESGTSTMEEIPSVKIETENTSRTVLDKLLLMPSLPQETTTWATATKNGKFLKQGTSTTTKDVRFSFG